MTKYDSASLYEISWSSSSFCLWSSSSRISRMHHSGSGQCQQREKRINTRIYQRYNRERARWREKNLNFFTCAHDRRWALSRAVSVFRKHPTPTEQNILCFFHRREFSSFFLFLLFSYTFYNFPWSKSIVTFHPSSENFTTKNTSKCLCAIKTTN